MNRPIALLKEVLPSGTPIFGPFDAIEDAIAPALGLPSYRFSQAEREFIAYSAAPLSENDCDALRRKVAARLETERKSERAIS